MKPIGGVNKFPYGKNGITVAVAKLKDGTELKGLKIFKQRSHNVFDLQSADGEQIYTFVHLTTVDTDGNDLPISADDDHVLKLIDNNQFIIRAFNSDKEMIGYVLKFQYHKVVLGGIGYSYEFTYDNSTVVPPEHVDVTGIVIDPKSIKATSLDETYSVSAKVQPDNATVQDVVFSTESSNIKLDPKSGSFTVLDNGTASIIAKSVEMDTITDTCAVDVKIDVKELSLSTTEITGTEKDKIDLADKCTIVPDKAFDKKLTFVSKDESKVKMNGSVAELLAMGDASVEIKTSNPAVSGEIKFKIAKFIPAPESIIAAPPEVVLNIGETENLTISVMPIDAPQDVTVVSLDTNIATVDKHVVTAKATGKTQIKVTSVVNDKISETVDIEVLPPKADKILVEPTDAYGTLGETIDLPKVTVLPEAAVDKAYTLKPQKEGFVEITETGIKLIKIGSVVVDVVLDSDSAVKASFDVTINAPKADTIDVAPTAIEGVLDSTIKLPTITVLPEAAVDKAYTLKPQKEGYIEITGDSVKLLKVGKVVVDVVLDSNSAVKAKFDVTINAPKPESIKVEPTDVSGILGSSVKVPTISVLPTTAVDKAYTLKPQTEGFVEIVGGDIKLLKVGKVVVDVVLDSNNAIKSSFNVTINKPAVQSIKVTPETVAMKEGERKAFAVEILPKEADQEFSTEIVTDGVITIEGSEIVGDKEGTTVVKFLAIGDKSKVAEINVTIEAKEVLPEEPEV